MRAGLEDHFCGKLLGVPMGCDVCYTNHAQADQDDMDALLVLLGAAGCNFIMGVPGADDVMLGYQSTSFHDAQFLRQTLGLRPAPEFETWLHERGVVDEQERVQSVEDVARGLGAGSSEAALMLSGASREELQRRWAPFTPARVALPRAGASVATSERLDFQFCHANARDAVNWLFDREALEAKLRALGLETLRLESDAPDRADFLQRPDWGRRLSPASRADLDAFAAANSAFDLAVVVSDGLSALAIERHAAPLLKALLPLWAARNWRLSPLALVSNGRVAIEDEIGQQLGARLALILIGERPGLGVPDSLSAYLVCGPRVGNTDERRNCLSNIRPAGMSVALAARKVDYLLGEMWQNGVSGVALKDAAPLLELVGV